MRRIIVLKIVTMILKNFHNNRNRNPSNNNNSIYIIVRIRIIKIAITTVIMIRIRIMRPLIEPYSDLLSQVLARCIAIFV